MNEIVKNEVRLLYKSFDKTDNFYEKSYVLTLLDYLHNIIPNDNEIFHMYNDISNKLNSLGCEYISFLLLRNQRIHNLMKENKDFFDSNIKEVVRISI